MKTNDIKKGMRILTSNGWFGTMYDNKKGNTRMAEIEGIYTEIGSIYAWDIVQVLIGDTWENIELTPKQIKDRDSIKKMGF